MPEPALASVWPMTRTKSPQLALGLCVEPRQMTIFDETALAPPLHRSRAIRHAKDRNDPDSWLRLRSDVATMLTHALPFADP
jgi:hypothetical protein